MDAGQRAAATCGWVSSWWICAAKGMYRTRLTGTGVWVGARLQLSCFQSCWCVLAVVYRMLRASL